MNLAAAGQNRESHREVAHDWHNYVLKRDLVLPPFSLNLNSLLKSKVDNEIDSYRCKYINEIDCDHKMIIEPKNIEEAWHTVIAYLKGTSEYEKKRIEKKHKK